MAHPRREEFVQIWKKSGNPRKCLIFVFPEAGNEGIFWRRLCAYERPGELAAVRCCKGQGQKQGSLALAQSTYLWLVFSAQLIYFSVHVSLAGLFSSLQLRSPSILSCQHKCLLIEGYTLQNRRGIGFSIQSMGKKRAVWRRFVCVSGKKQDWDGFCVGDKRMVCSEM